MFSSRMANTLILSVLLVFVTAPAGVTCRRKRDRAGLKFADCGASKDRSLIFHEVRASPIPIVTPGTLYVTFSGNITRDLPDPVSIELGVTKYFIGIPFPLPCLDNNLGSCLYEDICANLQKYQTLGCPKKLKQYDLQCHCPFRQGSFNVRNLPLNIPKIRGFPGAFVRVRGHYGLTLRVLGEGHRELGCLRLAFSLKKRYKGWLFQI